jgi:hypothetical protein
MKLLHKCKDRLIHKQAIWYLHSYVRKAANSIVYDEYLKIFHFVKNLFEETELLMHPFEAFHLYFAVKNTAKVPGDIAEVGVYKGASAKIICEARTDKSVYLFDTFEGVPNVMNHLDSKSITEGMHAASISECRKLLSPYPHVHIYTGHFPFPCPDIDDTFFSFVHLDVDTYKGTTDCLHFFYPKLSPSGVILCHNYSNNDGVHRAMNRFAEEQNEIVFQFTGTFGLIIKTRGTTRL